jgi:hypothetical protein
VEAKLGRDELTPLRADHRVMAGLAPGHRISGHCPSEFPQHAFGRAMVAHRHFSALPTQMIQILIDTILLNRIFRAF